MKDYFKCDGSFKNLMTDRIVGGVLGISLGLIIAYFVK